jgi:transaldolase
MTVFDQFYNRGQSIWLDYIQRDLVESGQLEQYIDNGLRGMTSNPTIFQKAIANSTMYDTSLKEGIDQGKDAYALYETLAIQDIRSAADCFLPVYQKSNGNDGFVSLEVDPDLAHDTDKTISEAKRLVAAVDRPNVMIKVPATSEGLEAISELIASGINVNVTLIFALQTYERVAQAYLKGLEQRSRREQDLSSIRSVASFFVSRLDSAIDPLLETHDAGHLKGQLAVANSKLAYERFTRMFSGPRWQILEQNGAHVQRLLWASTSTKNPAYSKTLYVETLIGPHTVNTLPPKTLETIEKMGTIRETITRDVDQAHKQMSELESLGIDYSRVTQDLLDNGLEAFSESFHTLLKSIKDKRHELKSRP